MPNFSIGVDLGGTNLRIAAIDEQGNLIEKVGLKTRASMGRDYVIHEMCDAIRRLTSQHEPAGQLLGIGIGVPGIIDLRTGFLRECPNLPGWSDTPVQEEVERTLGVKVVLENDANAAALGEKWLGAARHVQDLAIFTLGTGVGGGLMLDGKIWHGMTGMAGEFGHMTIDKEGIPCSCGSRGCLEQYASANAIMRMAAEAIDSGAAPRLSEASRSEPEFSPKNVHDLATQGDEEARKIFRQVGRSLGMAVSDLINVLNLPMYIIGGGISSAWESFAPYLFEELRLRSAVYTATATPVVPEPTGALMESEQGTKTIVTRALLGSEAGLYGAARLPVVTAS